MTKSHGDVDNDVPPRDEGCKIVEGVVGVHGVGKDDGEEVESDEDCSDPVEAELSFLIV